jgi:DNA-directed RNA polymerase
MMGSGFLKNLISGKGSEIITSVGEIADKFITTGQEKEEFKAEIQKEINRHTEAMQIEATKELEVYTKDMANARDMNSRIQESEKASWLSKNIAYILDLFVGLLWGTITVILFLKVFKIAADDVDMVSLMALHGTVTAVFMISMNFHRGSSIGSERKQKQLDRMSIKG